MDAAAKVISKGRVTVPKVVRDALGLKEGDEVVFGVQGKRSALARTADFLALAGTIKAPAAKRNSPWDDVIAKTHAARLRLGRLCRPGLSLRAAEVYEVERIALLEVVAGRSAVAPSSCTPG